MSTEQSPTFRYWARQCEIQKQELRAAEVEASLHKEKVERLRARLATSQTYMHNASKERST